ncbi:MAG: MoaD/ThiS family protein [Actinomycetes bacterium]
MRDDTAGTLTRPAPPERTTQLEVRYFAGAAAAAGLPAERLELPAVTTLDGLRSVLAQRHPRLEPVLRVATLLVDGVAVRDLDATLDDVAQVDVLPPFAGG